VSARQLSILLMASLALVACSSSDNTNKAATSETTTSAPSVTTLGPTTTIARIPFAAGLAAIQQSLAAAKGDPCKLYNFPKGLQALKNPATEDESKAAVTVLTTYFMDIADVLADDHPTQAASLRSATTKYTQAAEKANYDLTEPSVNDVTDEKGFQQAYVIFQQENANCAATSVTTVGR
jgi:hypothetical protein